MKNHYGIIIRMDHALWHLKQAMAYFMDKSLIWLPEYDQLAEWLTDNKGQGLLLKGFCGLGKTVFATQVLPALLKKYCRKGALVLRATEMNQHIREIKDAGIVVLDDIGTETELNGYGIKSWAFSDIMDHAEQNNRLIIITTNLNSKELLERYGTRTADRLGKLCKTVTFHENYTLR